MVSIRAAARARLNRLKVAAEFQRNAMHRRAPLKEDVVLYEAFGGNGMLCNPEAIFRQLLAAEDMQHLKHVWALVDFDRFPATIEEFAQDPRVSFVVRKSPDYFAVLARAKYLVNNATFPTQFSKREGQIYINTWHGTPIKAMGYDMPGGALEARNTVRNFLSADYLVAPNQDTADMYLTAYRMQNIYRGKIVAEGTPRIDKQFTDPDVRHRTKARLREQGLVFSDDQQILLYAPTWKGKFAAPTNDIRQLRSRLDAVSSQIDTTKYRVLLKVHQSAYKHAVQRAELRDVLVPNEIPTNEVLAIADGLITDYSSIAIDFLASNRPILFFTPDFDEYSATRGLTVSAAEWPGPVCSSLEELVEHIKKLGTGEADDPAVMYATAYATARERFCPREDGSATSRLVDVVFRGRETGYDIRSDFLDGRTSVLIHIGGLLNNGITSSALTLLHNIDYERFDVSVTFPHPTSRDLLRLAGLIDKRARQLPRIGGINGGKFQVKRLVAVKGRSASQHQAGLARYGNLMRDEWRRCFGQAVFDHVVDFSGYAPFWVKLFASRSGGSFSIWLHNDMASEVANPGRIDHLRASVAGVIALYGEADRLVSVSEALNKVNQGHFAAQVPAERFTFARNVINYERIYHLAYGRTPGVPVGMRVEPASGDTADLPGGVGGLMEQYGAQNVMDEVARRATQKRLVPQTPGLRTFVSVGRLSTEKNHERLIRAFDLVHEEFPETRLVILGDGRLRQHLERLVEELGLAAVVRLGGYQQNPYVVVADSDCFILSSDYEGQPMVLLEALTLGRPVVTTSFASVLGALPEGTGMVVKRTKEALVEGMRAFLHGEVPAPSFDPAAYNSEAMDEFYRAIGAVSAG